MSFALGQVWETTKGTKRFARPVEVSGNGSAADVQLFDANDVAERAPQKVSFRIFAASWRIRN